MGGDTMIADPLRRFEEEHQQALASLRRLEAAALALEAGAAPGPQLDAVHTILTAAVRAHNDN